MKRAFDIILALAGLVILSPVLAVVALFIKCDSEGPVFFKQERVGRKFRPFLIYKFRTMRPPSAGGGFPLTVGRAPRITRVGWTLRKIKLDEIPQLINVLKGDMSFVGPRPEVPQFVELFRQEYTEILAVRPGITDLASLKYRDEAALLGKAEDPEREYLSHVLPDKIRLAKDYLRHSSFVFDLRLILKTLFKLFDYRTSSAKG